MLTVCQELLGALEVKESALFQLSGTLYLVEKDWVCTQPYTRKCCQNLKCKVILP